MSPLSRPAVRPPHSHIADTRRKVTAVGSALIVALVTSFMGLAAGNSPAQAAPGSPGVPDAPTTVFHEDFENVPGTTNLAQLISDYASTGGTTYTASPSWLDTANCNGVVANSRTAAPLSCAGSTYAGFGATLMEAMGIENQSADAKSNYGLLEITSGQNDGADQIQLQTENGVTTTQPLSGRFVSFGITAAATTCNRAQPVLTFTLLNDGTELPTGNTGVNPCTDPRGNTSSVQTPGGGAIRVGSYFSSGSTLVGDAGDLGFIVRNVTASGSGNDLAFDDITIVDATPQLDKEFVDDEAVAGQPTTLRFTITNTSDLAQKDGWAFSDALPQGLVVADAPNASTTCEDGDITAAAGDAGISIENGNIATGVASCTVTVDVVADEAGSFSNGPANVTTTGLEPPGTSTITVVPAAPSLDITKTATLNDENDNDVADVGEAIIYGFTVTNDGNVPVTGISVDDSRVTGLNPTDVNLGPTEHEDFTADPYVVTEADVRGGDIVNTATATGDDPDGDPVTSPEAKATVTSGSAAGALVIDKQAVLADTNDNDVADVGETVNYSFEVTNPSNVTLTGVAISDARIPSLGFILHTLVPGGSFNAGPVPYVVTQDDIDSGEVLNSATASGTDPEDVLVTSPPDEATTPVPDADPGLTIDKTAKLDDTNDNGLADVGEEIHYTFDVTNTGNVTLRDVTIDDPKVTGLSPAPATLAPDGSELFTAEPYVVSDADVYNGSIHNIATATGADPGGDPVESDPDEATIVTAEPAPALEIVKSAALHDEDGDERADVGETIDYSFEVTNTGNVTVSDIRVDDDKVTGLHPVSFALAAGESQTVEADEYVVTAADVRSGDGIHNVATVSGEDPAGGRVLSDEDSVTTSTDLPGEDHALPDTGGSSMPLLVTGFGLTLAGAGLVVRTRRGTIGRHAA